MDPQILVILLVLAGIVLIFAELFLPSGGIIAVMCICCFLASGYFAHKAWYGSQSVYWWIYLGSVAFLIPATIVGAFQILTRTALGNRVLLAAPSQEEVTPYQREQQHLMGLINQRGVALNLMTPGGLVKVNGERLHAISDGLMIEADTEVVIVAVQGTRVHVRPVTEEERRQSAAPSHAEPGVAEESPSPDTDAREIDPWQNNEIA
jgi:membrane-bound serine protease (ClpP class)